MDHTTFPRRVSLTAVLLSLFLVVNNTDGFSVLTGSRSERSAKVVVTPAQLPQDLVQIQECRKNAFRKDKPIYQLMESQQRFVNATTVAQGRATCLVARGPGNVIWGTADTSESTKALPRQRRPTMTITNVFVTPEARGRGLAKQLLRAIEDEAIAQGVTKLRLQVYTNNEPAYSLYRRNNFTTQGIHTVLAQLSNLTGFPFLVEMNKDLDSV